jgi:hypothetical protein
VRARRPGLPRHATDAGLGSVGSCTQHGSDPTCDIAYEGWGEAGELKAFACEECGSPLQIVAFADPDRDGVAPGAAELQPRRAA